LEARKTPAKTGTRLWGKKKQGPLMRGEKTRSIYSRSGKEKGNARA